MNPNYLRNDGGKLLPSPNKMGDRFLATAYHALMLKTVSWTGSACRLLDQTRLPVETVYLDITDEKQLWDAIKRLVVRSVVPLSESRAAFWGLSGRRQNPFRRRCRISQTHQ